MFSKSKDTVNILKAEGYKFPPLKESDAMFSADTAPEWADGEVCHRCRTAFTLMVRRHHCRACGQVFCQQCSSKTSTLPKFGIEKEVRVCDACFDKVSRPPSSTAKLEIVDTASDYGPAPAQVISTLILFIVLIKSTVILINECHNINKSFYA
ncbi:unnamed protein product [Euphydryas editha]|uniref:FYVE-type domain-containing protein n=1 Tax=Euphydryas editha TaxID=104508 RepID=A0AAU9V878_EUPED|nr:unnamed protein product [Euphydryas editha]